MTDLPAGLTDEDVGAYRADGAVCLRGVFDEEWMAVVRAGLRATWPTPATGPPSIPRAARPSWGARTCATS